MSKVFNALAAIFFVIGTSGSVVAQDQSLAVAEANARVACGSGTVVSAQYLGTGALQVTCSQNVNPQVAETVLGGTALTTPAAAGALAVVTFLVILSGGSDNPSSSSTTTTTTTSTTSSGSTDR